MYFRLFIFLMIMAHDEVDGCMPSKVMAQEEMEVVQDTGIVRQ